MAPGRYFLKLGQILTSLFDKHPTDIRLILNKRAVFLIWSLRAGSQELPFFFPSLTSCTEETLSSVVAVFPP